MPDRFNSELRADNRSAMRRFFDREIRGRYDDLVRNDVLNIPVQVATDPIGAISQMAKGEKITAGVRMDSPASLENVLAVGMAAAPGGSVLKGTRTFGRRAIAAQVNFVKDLPAHVKKAGEILKKPITGAIRKNNERKLAVVSKALEKAKTMSTEAGGNPYLKNTLERQKRQTIAELQIEESQLKRRLAPKPSKASATSVKPEVVTSGPSSRPSPRTAEGLKAEISNSMYGGNTPLKGALKSYINEWPANHPGVLNTLGWGLLTAEGLGVGTAGVTLYDRLDPSKADERKAAEDSAAQAATNATHVAKTWFNVTNRVDSLSDANMARDILRAIPLATDLEVKLLGAGNPAAIEGIRANGAEIYRNTVAKIMDSDVFKDEVTRIRETELDKLAEEEAKSTYGIAGKGNWDDHRAQKINEFRQMSDFDVFIGRRP